MTKGIQIVKTGFSTGSAKSDELYVDINTPLFKLFKSGSGTQKFLGTAGEEHQIIIPHNLGYLPFFLFFMDRQPGDARQIATSGQGAQDSLPNAIGCFVRDVNTRNIEITANGFGGTPTAGTYGYNYFIYYDKITPDEDIDD